MSGSRLDGWAQLEQLDKLPQWSSNALQPHMWEGDIPALPNCAQRMLNRLDRMEWLRWGCLVVGAAGCIAMIVVVTSLKHDQDWAVTECKDLLLTPLQADGSATGLCVLAALMLVNFTMPQTCGWGRPNHPSAAPATQAPSLSPATTVSPTAATDTFAPTAPSPPYFSWETAFYNGTPGQALPCGALPRGLDSWPNSSTTVPCWYNNATLFDGTRDCSTLNRTQVFFHDPNPPAFATPSDAEAVVIGVGAGLSLFMLFALWRIWATCDRVGTKRDRPF